MSWTTDLSEKGHARLKRKIARETNMAATMMMARKIFRRKVGFGIVGVGALARVRTGDHMQR
jgi:hypothetical protein